MTLEATTEISFVNLNGPNGVFLPIFASQERLQEFVNQLGQKYGFLALRGSDLFPILTQHPQPAVLNPGAAYGKELTPDEIRRVADGSIFKTEGRTIQKDTQILLGQPAEYPKELVATLSRLFQQRETVQAAYLAQIHNPSSGEKPHLMIGIEAVGDFQRIVGEVQWPPRECHHHKNLSILFKWVVPAKALWIIILRIRRSHFMNELAKNPFGKCGNEFGRLSNSQMDKSFAEAVSFFCHSSGRAVGDTGILEKSYAARSLGIFGIHALRCFR